MYIVSRSTFFGKHVDFQISFVDLILVWRPARWKWC